MTRSRGPMTCDLVIFDVDGTLCDTCDVDMECFMRAAAETIGRDVTDANWQSSPHMTDPGIFAWLWQEKNGVPPTNSDIAGFSHRFFSILEEELRRSPDRFREIPGAKDALAALRGSGWDVAIGTGGWKRSAEMKLGVIGIPEELLLSSSDDSRDRVEIFRLAWKRSEQTRQAGYERVILVGDGAWDVHVASSMKWPFMGIGKGDRSRRLIDSGATSVLKDYSDVNELMAVLGGCGMPFGAGSEDFRPDRKTGNRSCGSDGR